MSAAVSTEGGGRKVSLPVIDCASGAKPEKAPHSGMGRWRAGVLIAVHVAIGAHVAHWLITGSTVSPVEPSESMETLERGSVNAGFVFFVVALLATLVFGRFFCGWGCHIVALQDLCGWGMKKIGVRPKPFRSRLLVLAPLSLAIYMFVWPSFKRVVLAPALEAMEVAWPVWLRPVEPVRQLSSGMFVEDFWETFPEWYVAIPFLLVVGFATVYFLGAKGFCTYGCPYGGFFAPVDKVAPVRIRVTDACAHCGHCTAVCTSNVRIHEEVRDFGMVVDPGCMKCMDCISACPNDALYLGIGRPALGAKARAPETAKKAKAARERRYDLSWPGEFAMVAVLLLVFIATRGMLDQIPMLMAGALAGIGVFLALTAWHVLRGENARIYGLKLKFKGRVRALGWAYLVLMVVLVVVIGWGLQARYMRWRGDMLYMPMDVQFVTTLRPEYQASAEDEATAREVLAWYDRAGSVRDGGWGWRLDPERRVRSAYLHAVLGEPEAAREQLAYVLAHGRPTGSLIGQIGQVIRASGGGRDELIELDRSALEAHPELHGVRGRLAQLAMSQGRAEDAEALWEEARRRFKDEPELLMSEAGYRLAIGDAGAGAELAREAGRLALGSKVGEPAVAVRAATLLAQAQRVDEAVAMAEAAAAHTRSSPETRLGSAGLLIPMGRVEEARAIIDGVLAGPAGHEPGVMTQAGRLLLGLQDLERGGALIAEASEKVADKPWEASSLGRTLVKIGTQAQRPDLVERGLEAMRRASEARPGSGTLRHDYAGTLLTVGRTEEGAAALVEAAEISDRNAVLAERAAGVLAGLGRYEEARVWQERAAQRRGP